MLVPIPRAEAQSAFASGLLPLLLISAVAGWGYGALRQGLDRAEREAATAEEQHLLARRAERDAIARRLHDGVARQLTLISIDAEQLARAETLSGADLSRHHRVLASRARTAREHFTGLMDVLRDDIDLTSGGALPNDTVAAALADARTDLSQWGHPFEIDHDDQLTLPNTVDDIAAHVVREAVANIRHHAPDRAPVHIAVTDDDDALVVEVANALHGKRVTPPGPGSGHGLDHLAHALDLSGGTLYTAVEDDTWVVRALITLRLIPPPDPDDPIDPDDIAHVDDVGDGAEVAEDIDKGTSIVPAQPPDR
ncbi:MAG: hypothetical protein Q4G43_09165 [Mobilicoccus sp.]|nr:hypothetical protein [Mobilicoccus sp.]